MRAPSEPPVGTIALLLTDIEGSTRLASRLGPAWPGVLAEHHRIVGGAIAAEDGWVDGTEGDAFFATWDDPAAAARAAVAALHELRVHRWPVEVGELRVRMGLHVGFVERTATGYVGLEIHRAARVASAAHGGQLLLSATARSLVGDEISTEPVGTHRLKDFPAPEVLYCAVVDGRGAAAFPPPRAYEARPTNLPAGLPALLGREQELQELCALLGPDGERLVTLTGRGGSGKTSLALVAGAALLAGHPGGVWLVPLAGVADPAGVLPAIAGAVGADGQLSGTALQVIVNRLAERGPAVLILDNLEHLLPDAAVDIGTLIEALPSLHVLATSQAPLRLEAERVLALDRLDDEAAIALIERGARRRGQVGSFVSADRDALLDIVRLLDGLPLALELAAARLGVLRPAQLRDRLAGSLDLLREDRSDRPPRQRSLRATVEWTLGLLDDPPRELFTRLGAIAGSVELEFIEAVADGEGVDVVDALAGLLDVGLLRRVETGDGRIRFGLPEALRRLAGERLDADPGGERWRRRHAEHVCEVLQPARLVAPTRPQFEVARAVGAEAAAALRWAWPADPQLAARIAAAHAAVLADSGRLRETLEVLEPLQRMPAVEPAVELTAIIARLHVLLGAERYAEALGLCDRAVELAGDAEEHSTVALMRGCIHLYGGNVTAALADHVEATRLARRCSPVRLATSLMMEAQARLGAGEVDRVEPLLAEAERIGLPADAYMLDRRMTIYADLSMAVGRPREALERYARSLEWAQSAGNDLQVMFDLAGVANALGAAGEAEAALEAIGMAAAQQAESGGLGADTVSHLMGDAPVREARERLGPERAAECEARGRAVPAALRVDRACRLARMVALDPMPGSDGSLLGERGAAR